MPIITGNKPIFRIKFRDANIREVRKGTELEWGLYYVSYKNNGPRIDKETGFEDSDKNIIDYVWGYPDYKTEDFYLYVPENVPSAEEEALNADVSHISAYRSHSEGWFDNEKCENKPEDGLNYIPAITMNFHKDLTLFCKWKQRQYRYSGTLKYDRYSWVEGDDISGG